MNYKITSVNELGREILDNESTIKKLHDINNNLKPKYYFLQYGVRDGSLVRWNFNHKIYRVLRFNLNYPIDKLPPVVAAFVRKDGTDGDERYLSNDYSVVAQG